MYSAYLVTTRKQAVVLVTGLVLGLLPVTATAQTAQENSAPAPDTKSPQAPVTTGLSSGNAFSELGLTAPMLSAAGMDASVRVSATDLDFPDLKRLMATGDDRTAPNPAAPAADQAPLDPAVVERIGLARQMMAVDGTEDLVRQVVSRLHMKIIVTEADKYLKINQLSEADRYRLSGIVANVATELGDKILTLNARHYAALLTSEELLQLIHDLDIAPQKKLTRMRLEDDGSLDRQAGVELELAKWRIIKAFETR